MQKRAKLIYKATFIAGLLDLVAVLTGHYLQTTQNPVNVLVHIASGLLGESAHPGNSLVILLGLSLHFFITMIFTLIFVKAYRYLRTWFGNEFLIAIAYGLFTWLAMHLIVIPNSAATPIPFTWSGALLRLAILVTCIGIPLSFLFAKNYGKA